MSAIAKRAINCLKLLTGKPWSASKRNLIIVYKTLAAYACSAPISRCYELDLRSKPLAEPR
jgi:hypothetical protein